MDMKIIDALIAETAQFVPKDSETVLRLSDAEFANLVTRQTDLRGKFAKYTIVTYRNGNIPPQSPDRADFVRESYDSVCQPSGFYTCHGQSSLPHENCQIHKILTQHFALSDMSERREEPRDGEEAQQTDDSGPIDYPNSLHVTATLDQALDHIVDLQHGRILNILDFPVGSHTVDTSDMRYA